MTVYVGDTYTKTTSNREAQVSAITHTHAILYWPDINAQTKVSLHRLEHRTKEWNRQ